MSETTTEILVRDRVVDYPPEGMQARKTERVEVQVIWPHGKPRDGYTGHWIVTEELRP
jgi:hypothetical protein